MFKYIHMLLFIYIKTPLLVYTNIILSNANIVIWGVVGTVLSRQNSMFEINWSHH